MTVTWDDEAPLAEISERFVMYSAFSATVEPGDQALPRIQISCRVERGRVTVDAVAFTRRPGSDPISRTLLRRVPLADYVRTATDRASGLVVETGTDGRRAITFPSAIHDMSEGRVALTAERRRGRVDDDILIRVAGVYREAIASGHPPAEAVMDAFDPRLASSTAGRWIAAARRAKFLGPARQGVAGEFAEVDEGEAQ